MEEQAEEHEDRVDHHGAHRRSGPTKSFWTRVGVGFVNRDGSITLRLDACPSTACCRSASGSRWSGATHGEARSSTRARPRGPQPAAPGRRRAALSRKDDAMLRSVRGASSRVVARVVGSRFAKPIARVALAAAGLLLLAFIGKTAVAGAMARAADRGGAASIATPAVTSAPVAARASHAGARARGDAGPGAGLDACVHAHTRATADDPVFLNTATVDDLRRLPGIGEKRADAILALRTRLGGRFHAVEDLLKVKGIGRATLRRLRPLVRLDPPPLPEAGRRSASMSGRTRSLPELVGGTVRDEHARDAGDLLALLQAVLRERRPRLDEVDDEVREARRAARARPSPARR